MEQESFSKTFLILLVVALVILIGLFVVFSVLDSSRPEVRSALWSALIILFLLFGVVVISLFIRRSKR